MLVECIIHGSWRGALRWGNWGASCRFALFIWKSKELSRRLFARFNHFYAHKL